MAQGSPYVFAIQDKDFRFWKIDASGNVAISAQPYFIDFSPAGWQDIEIENIRNKRYWGLDRTVATNLGFVQDGAKILRHIWTKRGISEETYLFVGAQQLDFEPKIKAVLEYTAGQSPLTPNTATTGTITGNPGDIITIKLALNNIDPPDDYINGSFDGFSFTYTGSTPTLPIMPLPFIIYTFTIPAGGVINFNITFHQGVGSIATATMEMLNENGEQPGYAYWYKKVFRGQVDWQTYNHAGTKVTVNSLEDGLAKYLKAGENIVQQFALDVPEVEYIKMDGIILHNDVENFVNEGSDISDPNYDFGNHLVDLLITKQDAPYVAGKKSVPRTKVSNSNSVIQATQLWFLKASILSDVEIEYDFKVTPTYFAPPAINPVASFNVVIRKIDSTGTGTNVLSILSLPADQINGIERHLTGSATITVNPDDELYLFTFCPIQGATGDAQLRTTYNNADPSFFNYKYKYRKPTTYTPSLNPAYLFAQHINRLTGNSIQADITGLPTTEINKKFTSGMGLRNLDNAVLKQTFSDFFRFFDTWQDAGIVVLANGKAALLTKAAMLDYSTITHIGEVSNLTVTTATDYPFKSLKIGFLDKKQEGLNGLEAFCNVFEWNVEALSIDKELDKTCNSITDCYSAEINRVDFGDKETTDSQQDNDVYVSHTEDTLQPASGDIPAHYKLDRALNPTATGLIEPDTVFNLGLTPKRAFNNNGGFFHGCLGLMETKKIKFQTASRNDKLVCGGITEKADVVISTLAAPYFKSVYLEFDTPGAFDLLELLDTNPLRLFSFSIDGNSYTVIPDKLSITPATGRVHRFKMLCAAGTDLSPLINYYG